MLAEFEHQVTDIKLIPSRGGVFEVTVDGDLVYSKKATKRHADPQQILEIIRSRP